MTDDTATPAAERRWRPLEATQRRVLGVLVEKAKTTPAAYPMSINAVVAACNQKNNRHPLMNLDDIDVGRALSDLATLKAASEIDWLGRVPKWKHHAHEWLGVTPVELAVMAELLLRGSQQLGELRARAVRMEPIADQAALVEIVDGLIARGLMVALTPPGRGQVVTHNLYLGPEMEVLRARYGGGAHAVVSFDESHPAPAPRLVPVTPTSSPATTYAPPTAPARPAPLAATALAGEVEALRAEVAELRERVAVLEARLDHHASE